MRGWGGRCGRRRISTSSAIVIAVASVIDATSEAITPKPLVRPWKLHVDTRLGICANHQMKELRCQTKNVRAFRPQVFRFANDIDTRAPTALICVGCTRQRLVLSRLHTVDDNGGRFPFDESATCATAAFPTRMMHCMRGSC